MGQVVDGDGGMGEFLVGSENTLASLPPNWSTSCQIFLRWMVIPYELFPKHRGADKRRG